MALITINGISLDPVAQSDALKAARMESPDASRSNYVLIQTSGPLTDEQKEELARLGVEIQEYVPENTYLCRYGPSDLDAIRALPFVVWADVYLEGFKIAPSLRAAPPDAATSVLPTAVPRSPSRKPREVDVVLHDDVDPNAEPVREQLAAAAGVDPDELQVGRRKVRLTVQEGQLPKLAALDDVHHIEPVPARQLFNNVARPILHADVVVNGTQYEGDGEIIAVADTGFDKGSTSNVHPAFTGRVAKLYALGRTSPAKSNDPSRYVSLASVLLSRLICASGPEVLAWLSVVAIPSAKVVSTRTMTKSTERARGLDRSERSRAGGEGSTLAITAFGT